MSRSTRCQLRPRTDVGASGQLPEVDLGHRECVVLGRGGKFGIQDKRCSKRHVELVADCTAETLTVTQFGSNPSWVGATPLSKGDSRVLRHADIFEPLRDTVSYEVLFSRSLSSPPVQTATVGETTGNAGVSCTSTSSNGGQDGKDKVPACDEISEVATADTEPCAKRPKVPVTPAGNLSEGNAVPSPRKPAKTLSDFWGSGSGKASESSSNAVPEAAEVSAKRGPVVSSPSWTELPGAMVFNSASLSASSCIASFDLDHTLIATKSGRVFPTDKSDWKWWHGKVVRKLAELHERGFKVVIFTNQAGIGKNSTKAAQFRDKVEAIHSDLKVPIQAFVATGNSSYRKPMTGMWQHLVEKENAGISVDLATSFYVGDAAGRQANWSPGKKKDHSCSDREFSSNLMVKFYTPEEFFLGERSVPFKWTGFNPRSLDTSGPVCDEPGFKLCSDSQEVVVVVGFPGSGKSTFCEQHLLSAGYVHVSRDKEGSWQKCVSLTEEMLRRGRSVVIDNTNPDVESRARYVKCAKAAKVPARCFFMSTSLEHAKHNNKIRMLKPKPGYKPPNFMAYNNYRTKYSFPTAGEGFSSVHMINFVPNFKSESDRQQYMQFLG